MATKAVYSSQLRLVLGRLPRVVFPALRYLFLDERRFRLSKSLEAEIRRSRLDCRVRDGLCLDKGYTNLGSTPREKRPNQSAQSSNNLSCFPIWQPYYLTMFADADKQYSPVCVGKRGKMLCNHGVRRESFLEFGRFVLTFRNDLNNIVFWV